MKHTRDYSALFSELSVEYRANFHKSAALDLQAREHLVDGGSHTIRLMEPFAPRIVAAEGAWVKDEDGHRILDFWQGHFANILGHNPKIITGELKKAFGHRFGLQTGFADRLQVEVADILCQRTGAERVRFTTSGSLATMYAILLARGYTGRQVVLKVGGGWHGAQPWGLKGVAFQSQSGYSQLETVGLPDCFEEEVVVTSFNNPDQLRDTFARHGDRVACLLFEPFVGGGGFFPATREYLQAARDLTSRYGAVLILDEVISGFRFRAGDLGAAYGIQPDLATFGKVIGGGMPLAAVAGRAAILNQAGRTQNSRVRFLGGTYSAHPAALLAARTMLRYLVDHEDEVYPRLADLGQKIRNTVEEVFRREGVSARCTGYGNEPVPGSSLAMIHFPLGTSGEWLRPEDANDPAASDIVLREKVFRLAMLLEGISVVHGLGAVSTAHSEDDIRLLGEACGRVAQRIRPYLTT